jgi:hypothetical protein
MHRRVLLLTCAVFAANAAAQEPKAYLDGTILQMDSVQCVSTKANGSVRSMAPQLRPATKPLRCTEYVLQTDRVLYRIRPKVAQNSGLLPVGERAQFRLQQDEMLLRVRVLGPQEREYIVVSITPRAESTADSNRTRLNHLQ